MSLDTMQENTSIDPAWKAINEDGSPISGYDHPAMVALRTGRPFGPFVMGVFQPQINDYVWLSINATPLFQTGASKPYQVYVIMGDITAEHKANRKYESLFREMVDAFALHEMICDEQGKPVDYRYLSVNPAFERMTGLKAENILGRTVLEILPETESYWIETYGRVALTGEPESFENFSSSLDKCFAVNAYQPAPNQFACTFTDITERKKANDDLVYLSSHDQLTGLYNRQYFEEKFKKIDTKSNLPITVAMGDINGLKLVNDSFGHFVGDELLVKASDIIKNECRNDDLIARIGGDEFAVVFLKTDASEATQIINSIQNRASNQKVANVALSISFGYDTKDKEEQTLFEVLANAENHMYRHKISERSSMRSNTIDIIINTLFEKSNRESLHSKRVSQICQAIAANMDFEKDDIRQITMAGLVHDIGKIGVDEKILNKAGKLDNSEWEEIKKHPETGWRILSATNEFSDLAQFILEHHEKWDGKGYPNGLKGQEIAVEARIIAIADAYDAMTHDRSYRKGFSKDEAAVEIQRCSGTQFDPEIVDVFVNKVLPYASDF